MTDNPNSRKTEERFEMAYFLVEDCFVRGKTELLDANDKCLELFDCESLYELNSYVGDSIFDCILDEDKDTAMDVISNAKNFDNYLHCNYVVRIKSKNGIIKWVEVHGEIIKNKDSYLYHAFLREISNKVGSARTTNRIDYAIDIYRYSIDAFKKPWEKCVIELLDKARDILKIDAILVSVGDASEVEYSIEYSSSNKEAKYIINNKKEIIGNNNIVFDRNSYNKKSCSEFSCDKMTAIAYGFFSKNDYEGALIFCSRDVDYKWTQEEKNALIHLGRCIHPFVQNARNIQISKELKTRQKKLEKDVVVADLINALCSQYSEVFTVNMDDNVYTMLRYRGEEVDKVDTIYIDVIDDHKSMVEYWGKFMDDDERKRFEETIDFENIKIGLWDNGEFEEVFRCYSKEMGERYVQLKVVGIGEIPFSRVVMGFVDVTIEKQYEEEYERNRKIVQALSDDYSSIFYVDTNTKKVEVFRTEDEDILLNYGMDFKEKTYDDIVEIYMSNQTEIEESDDVYKYKKLDNLVKAFEDRDVIAISYKRVFKDVSRQYRMKAVKMISDGDLIGVIFGFADIEDEYRNDLAYNNALTKALEDARSASESKTNFLFNMSHDIRTPMNAILGFSELAQKNIDNPDKAREYIDKIETSGEHLLSLINDVLDMARIENNKVELKPIVNNMEKHFKDTSEMFRLDMEKKGIAFFSSLSIEHKFLEVDALRIKQIELNLLGNALKYTKPGGKVWYKVSELASNDAGTGLFEIVVKDTGIGMSEEFQKHIFEVFEREKNSTIAEIQGTGLGLAIVKKLVDIMNGTISCESTLGSGTEFIIRLRIKLAEEVEDKEEQEIDVLSLKDKKVLLVEDNEVNREIAKMLLEEVGLIVDEAVDGTFAVDILTKTKPMYYDFVLMDIQMPYMDGYKATKLVRAAENKTGEHIPIVAMTANAFEEDKRKAIEAGMDAHLSKPVNMKELCKELVRLI